MAKASAAVPPSAPAPTTPPAAATPAPAPGSAASAAKPPPGNPILAELGFRYDPADLYQQTINAVLRAAELLELPHHLQLILAQPKTEVMVHFPVRMDGGDYRL